MPTWCSNPSVHDDTVLFVAEDDIWSVPLSGGVPRRLTAEAGLVSTPLASPDGAWIAVAHSVGGAAEVHVMPGAGGPLRRITWHGDASAVRAWHPDGRIVYTTAAGQPSAKHRCLHAVDPSGGPSSSFDVGPGEGVAFGPGGATALCRHQDDPARWKRYRGGRVGELWVDVDASGSFRRLDLPGNVARPMWIGDRLWFVSDADGTGNLWSVRPDGTDRHQHTAYTGAYVRHPSTDGRTVVFTRDGELNRLDTTTGRAEVITVAPVGGRSEEAGRSADASHWLEDADLHPKGHRVALTTRGRLFTGGCEHGPVRQLGVRDGVRYRVPRWLPNGYGLVVVSDEGGSEALEVRSVDAGAVRRLDAEIGRVIELEASPDGERVAFTNHRYEVGVVSLADGAVRVLDRGRFGRIVGITWSSDGRWLAWSRAEAPMGAAARIRAALMPDGEPIDVTDGTQRDVRPSFDPDGKYLYFLSARELDPVTDSVYFDYSFPLGMRPWVAVLAEDGRHPFRPEPRPPRKPPGPRAPKRPPTTHVDPQGLTDRIVRFPLNESIYTDVQGLPGGWVLLSRRGARGALDRAWFDAGPPPAHDTLIAWSFETQEAKLLHPRTTSFRVAANGETVLARRGDRLRVFPSDVDKATKGPLATNRTQPPRRAGWIDLGRVRLRIRPREDWRQMAREAWRLMRQHFWRADLGGVDWDGLWERYAPLLDRIATRSDLNEWLWLLQGELGTSHAYAMGGERPRQRRQTVGRLGARMEWDAAVQAWQVAHVFRGEPGDPKASSPLIAVGAGVRAGDHILEVDGVPLDAQTPPSSALVDRAGQPTVLSVRRGDRPAREVTVVPLHDDRPAVYRDWVLRNRATVREVSEGRCGYLHVPNMGTSGFAAFHRDFKLECAFDALIVDVRFNGGGHVSQLLLDKLSRRRLGWKVERWGDAFPYPAYARSGPAVCLTDAYAGSDGDIFSHAWRALGLGPLIGTRTWGGVVGIWPRFRTIDRGLVTQPEFASWWEDVGFGMENQGVTPDIEVQLTPMHHRDGRDPQLERALSEVLTALAESPPSPPPTAPGRTPGSSPGADR
ncbi:MAG: tricorn protease [Myxococcota bacterium]|jgi:tricorn protease